MATRVKQRSLNGGKQVKRTLQPSIRHKELQLRDNVSASNTKKQRVVDEQIHSSDSDADNNDDLFIDDNVAGDADGVADKNNADDDNDYEDADHARIRIAKQYLNSIKSSLTDDDDIDASDSDGIDDELDAERRQELKRGITASDDYLRAKVNERLQSDLAVQQRRHTIPIAASLHRNRCDLSDIAHAVHTYKPHSKAVTCCAVSSKYIVSGSLDGSVSYADIHTHKRIHTFKRAKHTGELGHRSGVLTCDITNDSTYIVTAGYDNNIHVWDTRTNTLAQKLVACHRDTITSLRFSPDCTELYSASNDRTVKVYNCNVNADLDENEQVLHYLDTLYGHTSHVTSLCTLQSTHVLSSGNDKSVRMFNKEKQTQLLYKGSDGSVDCISMFNDNTYISGNQSGQIQLWNSNKKKPLQTIANAHTHSAVTEHIMTNTTQCNWVTAAAAVPFSDLAVSGSSNNRINLYQLADNKRGIEFINTIHVAGIVNDLRFSADGKYMAVAVGREYRLGRWFSPSDECTAKNEVLVIDLSKLSIHDDATVVSTDADDNGITSSSSDDT